MMRSLYVLIEGLDFSGKTTVLPQITQRLQTMGLHAEAIDGGPLAKGRYRTFILNATEEQRYIKPIREILSLSMPLIDRVLHDRNTSGIVIHTSYLDRAYAYHRAKGNAFRSAFLRLLRPFSIPFDLKVLLCTDLHVRIARYQSSGNQNDKDDHRFFSEKGVTLLQCIDTELKNIASESNYRIVDNSTTSLHDITTLIVQWICDEYGTNQNEVSS